jgi:hypothetical protein
MYALNTQAARQADERFGRIEQHGAYTGVFLRAEDITSRNGARGIDFEFETAEKQSATFSVWTFDRQGKEIPSSMKLVSAMLTCFALRNIEPQAVRVKKWNRDVGARQEMDVEGFPMLMNKPIGVLFDTEDYQKNDGSLGSRVVLAGFYRAADGLMAGEILDKKVTGAQLQKFIGTLRHRPMRQAQSQQSRQPEMAGAGGGSFDYDVPFAPAYARAAWSIA